MMQGGYRVNASGRFFNTPHEKIETIRAEQRQGIAIPVNSLTASFFQKLVSVYHPCHPWQFCLRFKWSHSLNFSTVFTYSPNAFTRLLENVRNFK